MQEEQATSAWRLIRLWFAAVGLGLAAAAAHFAARVYLITYEDHYTAELGAFWSFSSMKLDEKVAYIVAVYLAPLLLAFSVATFIVACRRTFWPR